MTTEHINNGDIVRFADEQVNLKQEYVKKYREQVNTLRKKLEKHLQENPDAELRKMLLSGSLAKGTALKQLNDIDVALYIKQDNPPEDMPKFIGWLVDTLRDLYPNMEHSQITPQQYSVCISFKGSGLDVDIVPISYDGNEQWDGSLYSAITESWLMTNIYKHIEFIRKRKNNLPHYVQTIRLVKYWTQEIQKSNDNFKFKSFLIELIIAHLSDNKKIDCSNYIEALASFFHFLGVDNGLDKNIIFSDYYDPKIVSPNSGVMNVFDPVNFENNVAKDYQLTDKDAIVSAAAEAADAIDAALYATTKNETVRYWQKIFGSSFGG